MTYHSGTSGLGRIGIRDDVPRVECDGCGLVHRIARDRPPPAWLLDGKAPKGWRVVRTETPHAVLRRDFCPRCKSEPNRRTA